MSLTAVRSYFRTRMNGLGFSEWKDGFNFSNIPSNILDKTYHIASGTVTGRKHNQIDIEAEQTVTIRLFRKGFRDPAGGIDISISDGETIIKDCTKASNRLTGLLKNVVFDSMDVEAIDDSNDNKIVLTLNFTILTIINAN